MSSLPPFKDLPMEFDDWPREAQVAWILDNLDRVGLARSIVIEAGYRIEREVHPGDCRLTKEELAHVYAELLARRDS